MSSRRWRSRVPLIHRFWFFDGSDFVRQLGSNFIGHDCKLAIQTFRLPSSNVASHLRPWPPCPGCSRKQSLYSRLKFLAASTPLCSAFSMLVSPSITLQLQDLVQFQYHHNLETDGFFGASILDMSGADTSAAGSLGSRWRQGRPSSSSRWAQEIAERQLQR